MSATNELERTLLKVDGLPSDFMCTITSEEGELVTIQLPDPDAIEGFEEGTIVALVRSRYGQASAKTGSVESIDGANVQVKLEATVRGGSIHDDIELTDCQLPAMFRPRSEEGFYGCWRGAFIVKHGPDRLYLQVEEDQAIPKQTELMFSPIGADAGAGAGRMYGDDGSVINASDVRSRRIRVRALTRDVVPADAPGMVTLVLDITRTLYRTA